LTLSSGDYVVSLVNEAANIKRLYIDARNSRVVLFSESNANAQPIIIAKEDMSYYHPVGKVVEVIPGMDQISNRLPDIL
jgi:SOS-response transcriptional repressor LexA